MENAKNKPFRYEWTEKNVLVVSGKKVKRKQHYFCKKMPLHQFETKNVYVCKT